MRAREALGILEGKLATARCALLRNGVPARIPAVEDVMPWRAGDEGGLASLLTLGLPDPHMYRIAGRLTPRDRDVPISHTSILITLCNPTAP